MTPEHQREFDRLLRADCRASIIQMIKQEWKIITFLAVVLVPSLLLLWKT